jgi:signal peptidase II
MVATLIAAMGCWLDLSTKAWIFAKLGPPPSKIWWFIEGFFGLETAVNYGALFGMGQGQTGLLSIVAIGALVGILCWLWFGNATSSWLLTIALGLMLAGVMGNLYDRLGFWGVPGVRDWILFRFGRFTWPNFNVADMCLVVGAGVLILHSFEVERALKAEQAAAAEQPS